jgi:membrane protein
LIYAIKGVMKGFFHRFTEGRVLDISAQCAYYFLLSLFPFLIFSITLLGFLPVTSQDVLNFVSEHIPGKANKLIEENVQSVMDVERKGVLSLSFLFSLWTASKGIDALIYAMNQAYGINKERSFLRGRLLSITLTFGMIFVILSALILTVFGERIEDLVHIFLHIPDSNIIVSNTFRWMINFIILSLTFMALYYIVPNTSLTYKGVIPGALSAALGWQLASFGFSLYVNEFGNFTATYGSLGAVIILMTWFYLSAMILMIGGIINAMLQERTYPS